MRSKQIKWTPELEQFIVDLARDGWKHREIAALLNKQFGYSANAPSISAKLTAIKESGYKIKEMNITIPEGCRLPKDIITKCVRMAYLGIKPPTIFKIINKNNKDVISVIKIKILLGIIGIYHNKYKAIDVCYLKPEYLPLLKELAGTTNSMVYLKQTFKDVINNIEYTDTYLKTLIALFNIKVIDAEIEGQLEVQPNLMCTDKEDLIEENNSQENTTYIVGDEIDEKDENQIYLTRMDESNLKIYLQTYLTTFDNVQKIIVGKSKIRNMYQTKIDNLDKQAEKLLLNKKDSNLTDEQRLNQLQSNFLYKKRLEEVVNLVEMLDFPLELDIVQELIVGFQKIISDRDKYNKEA